jgi:hypothetical protein
MSLRALWLSLCAVLLLADVPAAVAGKIKMVFPGPVTTFSLPYLVAQKQGWLGDLAVEDVHVTGGGVRRRQSKRSTIAATVLG